MAIRTSSRVPIAEKAANRAMAGNDLSCNSSHSPFIVLNNTSTSVLHSVMVDLDIDIDNIEDQSDVFKSEEFYRATLARANYKNYLESLKEKIKP